MQQVSVICIKGPSLLYRGAGFGVPLHFLLSDELGLAGLFSFRPAITEPCMMRQQSLEQMILLQVLFGQQMNVKENRTLGQLHQTSCLRYLPQQRGWRR